MTNKKVLIVDDEEHIRELIKFNLKKEGYDTEVAVNGTEALKIIREIKFDLILLDLMLPEIDGLEVCKEIRRNERNFRYSSNDDYSKGGKSLIKY